MCKHKNISACRKFDCSFSVSGEIIFKTCNDCGKEINRKFLTDDELVDEYSLYTKRLP